MPNPSVLPRFFDNSTKRLPQSHLRQNDLQMAALSHRGHPIRHLRTPDRGAEQI